MHYLCILPSFWGELGNQQVNFCLRAVWGDFEFRGVIWRITENEPRTICSRTIWHQSHELAQHKTLWEDKKIKTTVSESHIECIFTNKRLTQIPLKSNFKGKTHRICGAVLKLNLKYSQTTASWMRTILYLFCYILHISLVVCLRHTKKTHSGGKHRNADALRAINALNSSCCALYTHLWGTFHFPLYVLSDMSYRC